MSVPSGNEPDPAGTGGGDSYPLEGTMALLDERLGLYLSDDQRRGLATGLLIGTAVGAALLAWNIGVAVRRRTSI